MAAFSIMAIHLFSPNHDTTNIISITLILEP